ncbi:MAG: hypothetical protein LQ348_004394 [Seirophora lacunosa]|nr:MAG: hypothetical protein LQ348_004394 [Seirophora lacunosa]
MASETYQKFGRGGAGNYYSKQDIQEAREQTASDLEAQHSDAPEPPNADATQPEYKHLGRGGAGNYTDASNATERKRSVDMTPTMREHTVPEGGFYGRGGAGNLRGMEANLKEDAEQKASHAPKEAHEKAVREVEQGLRAPEKAHLAD